MEIGVGQRRQIGAGAQSRCGLLAQGIANAIDAQRPADAYADSVGAVFNQIGLSLDHPYLNPRSRYPYQFPAAFA